MVATLLRSLLSAAAAALLAGLIGNASQAVAQVTQPLQNGAGQNQSQQSSVQLDLGWELADTEDGPRIEKIKENSAVAKAHLEEGDIVVEVGDEQIRNVDRIHSVLNDVQDDEVNVTVKRDGEELSYLVSLKGVSTVERGQGSQTEQNLSRQLQIIQQQLQQQQATLDALLVEIQSLRGQTNVNVRTNETRPTREYTGDVVAPLGVAPGNNTAPGNTTTPGAQPTPNQPQQPGGGNPTTPRRGTP